MSGTQVGGQTKFAKTEIPGLDEILPGGLPANRLYLVEGMRPLPLRPARHVLTRSASIASRSWLLRS